MVRPAGAQTTRRPQGASVSETRLLSSSEGPSHTAQKLVQKLEPEEGTVLCLITNGAPSKHPPKQRLWKQPAMAHKSAGGSA